MRIKHWMFIIGLLGIVAIAHADTLTNLDEITDPDDTDIMYIVDVSEGSGEEVKKITIDNLKTEFEAVGSGDNWSDPVDSDILPPDDTYDIGADSYQFANGWFDGTLEADTLTEDGNAVYNASETPGGELGGTWAAPTLDDSVTVDDWTLSSPTITTAITATGLIGDEDLQSEDFGDFTCAGEDACTLDADTIAAAEMANADHGDVAWTGGVAQVQDLSITSEATGSMLYYDGANWIHLAAGSNDDVVKLAGGVPTWAAGAGFSDLTDYEEQTPWRVFYSDADGDVTELALGADGDMLQSNGAAAAPTWETPPGAAGGDAWGDAVDADIIPGYRR